MDETKLLERIASLESKLSEGNKIAEKNGFDVRRATIDPLNYFKEKGVDVEHLTRVFVANAMGKDCPPHLATMAQMGPQIAATSHLEQLVTSLATKVDSLVKARETEGLVASVKNTKVDPSKYPTLAAAIKTDPTILDKELKSLGDIADPAKAFESIETKLAPYAKAFGFTAPTPESKNTGDVGTMSETKPEFKSANQGTAGIEVPPLLPDSQGVMDDDAKEKLKQAVLKKYDFAK